MFLFPDNTILLFRRKVKDGLSPEQKKKPWGHDIFFKFSEKMVFRKKLHWNMIFLVLSEKIIFLFHENMIIFVRPKMKDDLSQKNTWKYDIFFKCLEKMVFPKNCTGTWSFLCYLEICFFFWKNKHSIPRSKAISGKPL